MKCTFQEMKIASKSLRKKYCPLKVWNDFDNSERGYFHPNAFYDLLEESKVKFSFWKILQNSSSKCFLRGLDGLGHFYKAIFVSLKWRAPYTDIEKCPHFKSKIFWMFSLLKVAKNIIFNSFKAHLMGIVVS